MSILLKEITDVFEGRRGTLSPARFKHAIYLLVVLVVQYGHDKCYCYYCLILKFHQSSVVNMTSEADVAIMWNKQI